MQQLTSIAARCQGFERARNRLAGRRHLRCIHKNPRFKFYRRPDLSSEGLFASMIYLATASFVSLMRLSNIRPMPFDFFG